MHGETLGGALGVTREIQVDLERVQELRLVPEPPQRLDEREPPELVRAARSQQPEHAELLPADRPVRAELADGPRHAGGPAGVAVRGREGVPAVGLSP